MSQTSPFYVSREKAIRDAFESFRRECLDPWSHFNSGHDIKIANPRGINVHYAGIAFSGSPEEVFWSVFFLPCIEDMIADQFSSTIETSLAKTYFRQNALTETANLLKGQISKFLHAMADVDRRLRGTGYPERVPLRPVTKEQQRLYDIVDRHLFEARSQLKHATPSFWQVNQWWIQLLIAAAAALPGIIALFRD